MKSARFKSQGCAAVAIEGVSFVADVTLTHRIPPSKRTCLAN